MYPLVYNSVEVSSDDIFVLSDIPVIAGCIRTLANTSFVPVDSELIEFAIQASAQKGPPEPTTATQKHGEYAPLRFKWHDFCL